MCVVHTHGGVRWVGYWVTGREEGSDEAHRIEPLRVPAPHDCPSFFF